MAAKLTRLTHKIAMQLHLVAESCTSRSRRPVRELLDTPSYISHNYSRNDVCLHVSAYIRGKVKVKGKVVPVRFLTEHHAMKAYWWSGGIAPRIH
jgi:hypothetical protein